MSLSRRPSWRGAVQALAAGVLAAGIVGCGRTWVGDADLLCAGLAERSQACEDDPTDCVSVACYVGNVCEDPAPATATASPEALREAMDECEQVTCFDPGWRELSPGECQTTVEWDLAVDCRTGCR